MRDCTFVLDAHTEVWDASQENGKNHRSGHSLNEGRRSPAGNTRSEQVIWRSSCLGTLGASDAGSPLRPRTSPQVDGQNDLQSTMQFSRITRGSGPLAPVTFK